MKLRHESKLDYVSFSTRYNELLDELLPRNEAFTLAKLEKPFRFYSLVWGLRCGANIANNCNRQEQGCLFTASGEPLEAMRTKYGFSDQNLIDHIAGGTWGEKATRIDFAIDILDAGKVQHIERMFNIKKLLVGQRTLTKYGELGSKRGQTIYVGSLKSDLCVRVYDKGAERGDNANIVRVEVQARHAEAQAMLIDMAETGISEAGKAWIKRVVDCPSLAWFSRATRDSSNASIPGKEKGDFWEWMKGTVKPAILKRCAKEGFMEREKIREFVLSVLGEGENAEKILF